MADASAPLLIQDVEDVRIITLHRPERLNALSRKAIREICSALDVAESEDKVRALVFTGAGAAFSAGADLTSGSSTFESSGPQPERARDYGGILALRIFACTKPVLAAINGDAVGLGATMTLPMDIRIAAESARFGFVFARRGIVPEACSTWFLPRVVGISKAAEWTYSGRVFGAGEANAAGLVSAVVPPGELIDEALRVARGLTADSSPVSVAATRRMLWNGLGLQHPMEAHRIESDLIRSLAGSPDAREGVASFLEKRPARFTSSPERDLEPFRHWWSMPAFDPQAPDS